MQEERKKKEIERIIRPLDCPLFQTNLERAVISDCGLVVCAHCVQQSRGRYQICPICRKGVRCHQFRECDMVTPEVIDGLFKIKETIIKERDKTIRDLKCKIKTYKQHNGRLEESTKKKDAQNDYLRKALTATKKELVQHKNEVDELHKHVKLCSEKEQELQDLIQEKDDATADLNNQIAKLSAALKKREAEVKHVRAEVERYVQICSNQSAELENVWESIIPEKENTITDLRRQIARLTDELDTLRRETVTIVNLEALAETELCRAIQQLQHCYDREYRCRYEITDKMAELLQTRLEVVMNELCASQEIGDRLALVISTYISILEENANLHRTLRAQTQDMNRIRAELRQTKVNKLKLEQKHHLSRMPEE